jgi:hypothetical protein
MFSGASRSTSSLARDKQLVRLCSAWLVYCWPVGRREEHSATDIEKHYHKHILQANCMAQKLHTPAELKHDSQVQPPVRATSA